MGTATFCFKRKVHPRYRMCYFTCFLRLLISHAETGIDLEMLYVNAYMWHLEKWYRWSHLQGRNSDTDVEKKRKDTKGGGVVGWIGRMGLAYRTYRYRADNWGEPTVQHSGLCSALCGDLNGKEIWRRGAIHTAETLCCTAETNTTLKATTLQ